MDMSSKNLVIEAEGTYWHALFHKLLDLEEANDTQKDIYKNDSKKSKFYIESGYNILRILEKDFEMHKKTGDTKRWLKRLLD